MVLLATDWIKVDCQNNASVNIKVTKVTNIAT